MSYLLKLIDICLDIIYCH